MTEINIHPASYRDSAGFVFTLDGVFYRQVNQSYARQYDTLIKSGLYDRLAGEKLLLPHTEAPDLAHVTTSLGSQSPRECHPYLTLLPRQLPRLSYPSEWCPQQLKDAALLTLRIQQLAMDHGMTLKDATPFNVQFDNGKPIFIDTLSFDLYDQAKPWIAYRQFCECFLFPLYLHHYTRIGTHHLSGTWPDGIPVATTARLLPFKSRWNAGAWMHVFLQNQVSSHNPASAGPNLRFSKTKLSRLIDHLYSIISRPTSPAEALAKAGPNPSAWSNYYRETILGPAYLEAKQQLFRDYLREIEYSDALDLGCNEGLFSKILAEPGIPVIAVDSDWPCIDRLYRDHFPNVLPLCIDLANPTPASGFRNAERASFTDRASSDLVVALALIHHLSLHKNIPLPLIADYFNELAGKYLLIEFIPASDIKAQQLIARKTTLPDNYDIENFESAFNRHFRIEKKDRIPGTERDLYLLKKC